MFNWYNELLKSLSAQQSYSAHDLFQVEKTGLSEPTTLFNWYEETLRALTNQTVIHPQKEKGQTTSSNIVDDFNIWDDDDPLDDFDDSAQDHQRSSNLEWWEEDEDVHNQIEWESPEVEDTTYTDYDNSYLDPPFPSKEEDDSGE